MKTSIVALALLASRTRADVSLGRRLIPAVARSAVAPPNGDRREEAQSANRGRQVRRAPKKGRPRIEDRAKTIEAKKPWLKLNMSRRTWYRRQAEKRKGRE